MTNFEKLLAAIGLDTIVTNHSMTLDEMLDLIHCGVDEEGEIVDLDTGKLTGVWYEDLVREGY